MPYNGAGTYAAPASTFNPAVTNTAINSTDWIALLADLTTALSTCVLKDGQQTPTANIPMGGFKFTGLAAGSAAGNSLRYEQLFTTGAVNLLGPVNEVKTTVASAATPDIWTSIGNVIDYTGTVTATGFAAAPQAGARRVLICAAAAPFTAGANMLIDGVASGSTYTAIAGDRINVVAVTTTQFRLTTPHTPFVDTYPIAQGSADATKQVRLEVDGLTTGTTRVLTTPDADIKIAGHATGLTANRIPYASGATGGVLTDNANLTFDGTTLGVAGGQIAFPATQNPSANANTLDDYEEGTWTPTGIGQTFTSAVGSYTKIGRVVHFSFDVTWSATAAGNQAGIGSLPFTVGGSQFGVSIGFTSEATPFTLIVVNTTARMDFYALGGGATILDSTMSGDRVVGAGTYFV